MLRIIKLLLVLLISVQINAATVFFSGSIDPSILKLATDSSLGTGKVTIVVQANNRDISVAKPYKSTLRPEAFAQVQVPADTKAVFLRIKALGYEIYTINILINLNQNYEADLKLGQIHLKKAPTPIIENVIYGINSKGYYEFTISVNNPLAEHYAFSSLEVRLTIPFPFLVGNYSGSDIADRTYSISQKISFTKDGIRGKGQHKSEGDLTYKVNGDIAFFEGKDSIKVILALPVALSVPPGQSYLKIIIPNTLTIEDGNDFITYIKSQTIVPPNLSEFPSFKLNELGNFQNVHFKLVPIKKEIPELTFSVNTSTDR